MARIHLTINVAERMALEGYKRLTSLLAETPEWERPDMEAVIEIMEHLRDVAGQVPDPRDAEGDA
jgi:hypothetical protein